jgi:hypothetical protein
MGSSIAYSWPSGDAAQLVDFTGGKRAFADMGEKTDVRSWNRMSGNGQKNGAGAKQVKRRIPG